MTAETSENTVYSLQSVRCGYAGKPVLKGLDWILPAGEAFAILGMSGEGKSLLLKTLAGLIPDYTGSLKFKGVELRKMTAEQRRVFRHSIGMTFQKDGLFDSLVCAQNLHFPLQERLKLTRRERDKRVEKALDEVGLRGQGALMVHEMSGGMQKRLGIARALLFSPQVILYDEPSAGLDPITAAAIDELIVQMRDLYKMTVVLVTSDLHQAQHIGTQMGLLWRGRFEQVGKVEALRRSSNAAVHQFFNGLSEGPLTGGG